MCSLRGKHQFLQKQLEDSDVAICALQETRAPEASALVVDGWLRFGTAAERGHLGVAIWIRQAAFASGKVLPGVDAVAVIQQSKDWLALRFQFGDLDVVRVALHAPHSGHPADSIQAWWHAASARLDSLCSLAPLILLRDVNAVVTCDSGASIGGLAREEPDLAGELFAAVLYRFDLAAVNTFPSRAYPDDMCPTFGNKCIDDICVPCRWISGAEQVASCVDLGTLQDDHALVEVVVHLSQPKKAPRRGGRGREALGCHQAAPGSHFVDC